LAKERLDVLDLRKSEYKLVKTVKGKELIGLRYQPLYELPAGKFSAGASQKRSPSAADDSVSLEDGTGVLHSAPRYGEPTCHGPKARFTLIESVDSSGHLIYGPKRR